jgi:WD40 repeat protein
VVTASADHTGRVWDAATGEPVTVPLRHVTGVLSAAVSPDGRRVVTASERAREGTLRLSHLPQDVRPLPDLLRLTRLLSCRRIDAGAGSTYLTRDALQTAWRTLRARYPADFSVSREQGLQWHRRQVEACERQQQWSAAVFHYDQLLAALPGEEGLRRRRAHAAALAGRNDG